MPKIVRLHAFGGPERLDEILRVDDVPSEVPGPGEVLLRVEAASVTRDHFTFMAGAQYRGHGFVRPPLPSRLGYEAAGVVRAVGAGVDPAWVGERVATIVGFDASRYGVLGEEAVVPVGAVSGYPARLSPAEAAAFWVPYLTAYGGLVALAQVTAGDVVALPAGGSAVGLAAVQLARDAGATSIALTRTAAKRDALLALDARARPDHVVVTDGPEAEDYAARARALTGGAGVRVTFDPVAGPFLERLAEAAAPGGVLVVYGRESGEPTPLPLFPLVGKGLVVRGFAVSQIARDPGALAAAQRHILDRLADGRFVPRVARTFPLAEVADAYRFVATNAQLGRVVVTAA